MVYVVRHGETVWNVLGKLQGGKDSELSDVGKNQANAVGKILLSENPEAQKIYSSPKLRTSKTSEIIVDAYGDRHMEIIYNDLLREMSFGTHEGMTKEARKVGGYLDDINKRKEDPYGISLPLGENYSQVQRRAILFLENVSLANEDIIVSHSGFNRMLLGILGNIPNEEALYIDQANDVIYKCEGGKLGIYAYG